MSFTRDCLNDANRTRRSEYVLSRKDESIKVCSGDSADK